MDETTVEVEDYEKVVSGFDNSNQITGLVMRLHSKTPHQTVIIFLRLPCCDQL